MYKTNTTFFFFDDSVPDEESQQVSTLTMGQNFWAPETKSVKFSSSFSKSTQSAVSPHFISKSSIKWHMIPPRAPHFGGLWEAAVKSMKTLLSKLVAPHHLKYQELETILTEAEAVLNSRPLAPVHSTDAEDPLVLTAGHFIIGRPLKAPPTAEADETAKLSLLKR